MGQMRPHSKSKTNLEWKVQQYLSTPNPSTYLPRTLEFKITKPDQHQPHCRPDPSTAASLDLASSGDSELMKYSVPPDALYLTKRTAKSERCDQRGWQ